MRRANRRTFRRQLRWAPPEDPTGAKAYGIPLKEARLDYPEDLFFSRQDERELPNLSQDNAALQQDAGSRN
jgi:hypothetical protein